MEGGDAVNWFSHCGDFGDTIAHLPAVKALGGGKLVLYPAHWTGNRMTKERAEVLAPLLRAQPYIESVEWREKPFGFVLDEWRNHYNHSFNLTDMFCRWLKQPHPEREQPWLTVLPRPVSQVVFHRSHRYQNWNFPWRAVYEKYKRDAIFVGTVDEHADFCSFCGPISYHHTPDMLELAKVIAGCQLYVGNQSSPYWVAEGLKVPTILEIFPRVNNCHWERVGNIHGWGKDVPLPELCDLPNRYVRSIAARASGHTLITPDRLETIARLVAETAHLPGEMAELGVYKGGSAKVIASMAPGKLLRLFDTFEGIPEDDTMAGGHKKGEFSAHLSEVLYFLSGYRIVHHPGKFPDTAYGDCYSFVHLDADTYQSTAAGIEYFWQRLVPGGVLVLDDYDWQNCPGVRRAVDELLQGETLQVGNQQAWVRKNG